MATIYFLLIIVTVASILAMLTRRIESRSYTHGNGITSKAQHKTEERAHSKCRVRQIEENYVERFMSRN
jgi:hypothetical protein